MATLSFRRMSAHSRDRVLLQYLFVIGLVVDLHGGKHAHHGAVEGDGEHEVGHVLVRKRLLDLAEGRVGHADIAGHLARALERLEGLPSVSANRPLMSSSVTPNSLPIL